MGFARLSSAATSSFRFVSKRDKLVTLAPHESPIANPASLDSANAATINGPLHAYSLTRDSFSGGTENIYWNV